jgi:hypothetical protein
MGHGGEAPIYLNGWAGGELFLKIIKKYVKIYSFNIPKGVLEWAFSTR